MRRSSKNFPGKSTIITPIRIVITPWPGNTTIKRPARINMIPKRFLNALLRKCIGEYGLL
jgi:hypothetical protein